MTTSASLAIIPHRGRWLLAGLCLLAISCSKSKPTPADQLPATEADRESSVTTNSKVAKAESESSQGLQLYATHCAACHGVNGDGNGAVARFVYPKPRNFREAKFRLVTTTNRVPSDEDLLQVITRGMPGSAMFPFGHLSESDRNALVDHVRRLTREGVEDRYREIAAEFGDELDPKQLAEDVDLKTLPQPKVEIPTRWPAADGNSVSRGRAVYVKQGCASCHGDNGKGDGVQEQRDDDGTPTRPRDYTRGVFKGGRGRDQLYARTLLGMPGTPMPSSANLQHEQIADLVHYIQSLADPFAQSEVEHKRTRLVAQKSNAGLASDVPEPVWADVPSTHIVISPLWWRDYDEPALAVQALHDGQTLAIRLSWRDATKNERSVRPQDFKDMAAIQLFRGTPEPFLGMGSTGGTVDLWIWEADVQADLKKFADVDTVYPNLAVDEYQFESHDETVKDAARGQPVALGPIVSRSHPTERQSKDYLTALAAGNLRSDLKRDSATSGSQATGFGSLTLLPRPSQLVGGKGQWSDGRWSVVLRRSLSVAPDAGLSLAGTDRVSIAFAIWDGAAADRNGQKLVSIWHDLELEK